MEKFIIFMLCFIVFSVLYFLKVLRDDKKIVDLREDIIFDVDNFNDWFNDKNNGATYAHIGIFLRLDKLSNYHITEYLFNRFNIKENNNLIWSKPFNELLIEFEENIREDWFNKK